jgi:hypothetical protein
MRQLINMDQQQKEQEATLVVQQFNMVKDLQGQALPSCKTSKCMKDHIFPKQKFASLHGDHDFRNNPQSICQTMAAALNIAEEEVEGW